MYLLLDPDSLFFCSIYACDSITSEAMVVQKSKFKNYPKVGHEVDIVLERGANELAGVEAKASATVMGTDFRGLREKLPIQGKPTRK
jgi:hypothetical protein